MRGGGRKTSLGKEKNSKRKNYRSFTSSHVSLTSSLPGLVRASRARRAAATCEKPGSVLERGFCHGKNEGGGKCEFFRVFFSIKEKQFKQEGGEEKKARDSQSPLPRVLHHRPQAPPDRPEPLRQGRRRRPAGLALPGRADERDEVAERRGLLRRLRFGFFGTFDLDVDDAVGFSAQRRRGGGRGGGGSAFVVVVVVLPGRSRVGAQRAELPAPRRHSRAEARGGGGGGGAGSRCRRRRRRRQATTTEEVEAAVDADADGCCRSRRRWSSHRPDSDPVAPPSPRAARRGGHGNRQPAAGRAHCC